MWVLVARGETLHPRVYPDDIHGLDRNDFASRRHARSFRRHDFDDKWFTDRLDRALAEQ